MRARLDGACARTESMPTAVQWHAGYQPFTPIMETVRGLLLGTGIGNNAWLSTGWCAAITMVGYLWAKNCTTEKTYPANSIPMRPRRSKSPRRR